MTASADSTPVRVCKGCGKSLPATLEYFPQHKMGKYGLFTHCRPCKKLDDTARRNRPDQLARQQKWRDENKSAVKAANAAYRAAGYKSTTAVREWRNKNIEYARQKEREKVANYRKTKPWYNLKARIHARIRQMLCGSPGRVAKQRTMELLGYSLDELVSHIESKFSDGMSWPLLMQGKIHIDHIVPVVSFNACRADSQEFKRCWSLDNLQPLWAADNWKKGARI